MSNAILHPYYRVVPAGFARGFWVGQCKLCPPEDRYLTAKSGFPTDAEKALWDHLRDRHHIEAKEATP